MNKYYRLFVLVTALCFVTKASTAAPLSLNAKLGIAAQAQNAHDVKILLSQGANPNNQDDGGFPPLISAISGQQHISKSALYLVKHGANVNWAGSDGKSVLMFAAMDSGPEVVSYLLRHGAKVDRQDEWKATPLLRAACFGGCGSVSNPDAGNVLITHGADVNHQDNDGNTALMLLTSLDSFEESDLTFAKNLIKHGADVNLRNKRGETALGMLWKQRTSRGWSAYANLFFANQASR